MGMIDPVSGELPVLVPLLLSFVETPSTAQRKDGETVAELTEQKVIRLAMSPLHVIYAVASAQFSPARITRRQIIRAVEYGLSYEHPFTEGIFELFKMHLHKFFAKIPKKFPEDFDHTCFLKLRDVQQILQEPGLPQEGTADFRKSLRKLALFVAEGSVFGSEDSVAAMASRVARIDDLFPE